MPRQRSKLPSKTTPTFTEHDLCDAAGMITLEDTHPFWTSTTNAPTVKGSFVRIFPPAGLTPEQIATFKQWLLQDGGADAVKVMPVLVEVVPDAFEVQASVPEYSIRKVVFARAARTPGVRSLTALNELLTSCMDKARI